GSRRRPHGRPRGDPRPCARGPAPAHARTRSLREPAPRGGEGAGVAASRRPVPGGVPPPLPRPLRGAPDGVPAARREGVDRGSAPRARGERRMEGDRHPPRRADEPRRPRRARPRPRRAYHGRRLRLRPARVVRRGDHGVRRPRRPDGQRPPHEPQRRRTRALRAPRPPRGARPPPAARGRSLRSVRGREAPLHAGVPEHDRARDRPQPHRRHRAHDRPRRPRAEEAHGALPMILPDKWNDAECAGFSEPELLLYRSNLLGSDLRITNYGGGNTSAKIEMKDPLTGREVLVLWVKGSGGGTGSMKKDGFATLYVDKLQSLNALYRGLAHEDEMAGYFPHCAFDLNPRATSIDTPPHCFIPHRHIDHMHADAIIALAT